MRWLLLLAVLATGCISARASIGPTITTDGDVGVDATVGIAIGLHKPETRLLSLGVDGGGTVWPGEPSGGPVVMDSLELVNVIERSGEPIIRPSAKFGLRNFPDGLAAGGGVGVAILPYTRRTRTSGDHHDGKYSTSWWTSWSQWGIGVEAQFLYLASDERGVGFARVAPTIEWTMLAR